jgi:hypothetical protein
MQQIRGHDAARAILTDATFVVPQVPPATTGIAWLRATVGRFATGPAHIRRRALSADIIKVIEKALRLPGCPTHSESGRPRATSDPAHGPAGEAGGNAVAAGAGGDAVVGGAGGDAVVGGAGGSGVAGRTGSSPVAGEASGYPVAGGPCSSPVAILARAMNITEVVVDLIRDVAQAYQPGTGDDARADVAVERLIGILGGAHDEYTAARIGVLVQACDATANLKDRLRDRPLDEVLRDDPPVRFTKRQATAATGIGGVHIGPGEVVLVELSGDLAFGAGPRRCPGADLAIALAAPQSDACLW